MSFMPYAFYACVRIETFPDSRKIEWEQRVPSRFFGAILVVFAEL